MAGGLYTIVLIVVIPILERMYLVEILTDHHVTHTCYLATNSRKIARSLYFIQIRLPLTPIQRKRVLLSHTLYGMQNIMTQQNADLFPATPLYSVLFKIKDQEHPHPPIIVGIGVESISWITDGKSLQRSVTTKSAINSMHSFYIIIPLTQTLSDSCIFGFQKRDSRY